MTGERAIDRVALEHVCTIWPGRTVVSKSWPHGRIAVEVPDFRVLEVHPETADGGWAYVSSGAWRTGAETRESVEFVILSRRQDDCHVETLAMVTSMHGNRRYRIDENRIMNIGRSWVPGSACDHLLACPPYFFEEGQEKFRAGETDISYVWLVPVTAAEAEFGRRVGGHALFHELADAEVDLLDIDRRSLRWNQVGRPVQSSELPP